MPGHSSGSEGCPIASLCPLGPKAGGAYNPDPEVGWGCLDQTHTLSSRGLAVLQVSPGLLISL